MRIVYDPRHESHRPQFELYDGRMNPAVEHPGRAEAIRRELRVRLGVEPTPPRAFGLEPILRVHDREYVRFLEGAHAAWRAAGRDGDALPLAWPVRGFLPRRPRGIDGLLSFHSFDAGTPITPGSFEAARAAVDVALTAAQCVRAGERAAFALTRPPGHHASRDVYGGYCFLNNAAVAAAELAAAGARVAILDVDYHHGNGTQAIFYDRSDVLFVSIHADPDEEYPFFLGRADETGAGAGDGFTRNLPLPLGTDWSGYERALTEALEAVGGFAPDVLVLSLGVDTFEGDPISRFRLRSGDFSRLGAAIAARGWPTLVIMEGGYATEALGPNVANVLDAFR